MLTSRRVLFIFTYRITFCIITAINLCQINIIAYNEWSINYLGSVTPQTRHGNGNVRFRSQLHPIFIFARRDICSNFNFISIYFIQLYLCLCALAVLLNILYIYISPCFGFCSHLSYYLYHHSFVLFQTLFFILSMESRLFTYVFQWSTGRTAYLRTLYEHHYRATAEQNSSSMSNTSCAEIALS